MNASESGALGPLGVLRRLPPQPSAEERCEMCGEPIGEGHRHVVDLDRARLLCTCRGCGLLFSPEGAGGGRYRAVPDRYRKVASGPRALAFWEALEVPVGVAFFLVSSKTGRASAFYPGPAGATESLLALGRWDQAITEFAAVPDVAADVEALLVRVGPSEDDAECFIVPVDACYELAGRMRRLWRGFDGGAEARAGIEGFFAEVRSKCP